LFSLPDACQVIVVLVVSLKQTRAFRSMSFIAIVALIAGPIERRHMKAQGTAGRL
jgi:hypothetical protein